MSQPSRLIISFDFELGWGVLDTPTWRHREQQGIYRNLRPVFEKLMALLAATRMPTTWGIVSSSLADRESELDLEHLPKGYSDAVRTFFREAAQETRNSTDLMEKWLTISDFSELCSHSSTHIHADYPALEPEAWVQDILNSCNEIEKKFGLQANSLILPRDQDRFRLNLSAIRPMNCRLSPSFLLPRSAPKRTMGKICLGLGHIPPSIIMQGGYGETYHTGSLFFNWPAGRGEWLRRTRLQIQKNRLLAALENTGNVYHVWLHPFNLARTPLHYEAFADFIAAAARLRDAGKLEVLTMRQAQYCHGH